MFCPKCGRQGKGLCIDCYLEGNPFAMKPAEIQVCECDKSYSRGRWDKSMGENLLVIVSKNLVSSEKIKVNSVDVESEPDKKHLSVNVLVKGDYLGEPFETSFDIRVKVVRKSCPVCSKKRSGSFEAILQIRNPEIEINFEQDHISTVEKVRGGIDVYLISNSYARRVARQFKKSGYTVKRSAKLYGQKEGKDVYRTSYSIK